MGLLASSIDERFSFGSRAWLREFAAAIGKLSPRIIFCIDAAMIFAWSDFVNVFNAYHPLGLGIGNIALAVAANGRFFLNYYGTELALSRFTGVQSSAFGPTR